MSESTYSAGQRDGERIALPAFDHLDVSLDARDYWRGYNLEPQEASEL